MRTHLRRTLVAAVALACVLPAGATAAGSPSELHASILAAARAEQTLQYSFDADFGEVGVSLSGDAGATEGVQRITYRKGKQTGHVTLMLIGDSAYVRGDAFTLANYLQFKQTPALKYEGKWIRFPHNDAGYASLAAGVTLSSAIDGLKLTGGFARVADMKIDGEKVLGVTGTSLNEGKTAVHTLYAQADSHLPVREIVSQGTRSVTFVFSKWNQPIHLTAPTTAVPISIVRKTKPSLVA